MEPCNLFGGDFIFRAVQVQGGQNTVKFSYRHSGFQSYLILSWGTLGAVLVVCILLSKNNGFFIARLMG
jgi:hypothetical protein